MAVLEAGGDFADGVIAHAGRWMGGETFASFDKRRSNCSRGKGRSLWSHIEVLAGAVDAIVLMARPFLMHR
jgi:hypothetical protein